MGQSLTKNFIHIVFSTKHRKPLIDENIEKELHSYLGGICNNLDCQVLKVGGFTDHIHILCLLSKKITLMELMKKLKSDSSKCLSAELGRDKNKRR
jgi:REP element-mobilizing transposase RayT